MRFFLFQFILTVLLSGIQYFLYRGISTWFRINGHTRGFHRFLTLLFLILNAPLLGGLLLRFTPFSLSEVIPPNALIPVYLWHFVSFVLFLVLMFGKLVKLPFLTIGWLLERFRKSARLMKKLKTSDNLRSFDEKRREVIRHSLTILTGSLALGSVYEVYKRDTFDVTEISLAIKNLPPSFEGYSIGFISDIHSGMFMDTERMHEYATAVNAMNTEMIVLAGDFVNSDLNEVYPFTDAFRILRATDGVYGVLGNHDYYTRRVEDVAREINGVGIDLLRNQSLTLMKGSERVLLAGVDDTGSAHTAARYFAEVNKDRNSHIPKILLCHRPYFFREAARTGFDLVLSGHTHGGQVVLGELGRDVLAPARIVSPYVAGLYKEAESQMYVSRGIGTVGVPFRFNCPPEITRITLTRAATA